ncbi:MAG TPA: PadR family transcriptional regulator [Trebonia sp.]|nr:PadR family transcriptional regulator [Trebonia sp.]
MNEEHRRGPRGEGWGQGPRRGRGEWAAGGPAGPGAPGFGPGYGPGFGSEFGPGRGFGGRGKRWGGPEAWGWEGPGPVPEFVEHLKEFHRHGRGHHRARRGDVRAAILDLLADGQPRNGYQLIQEIAERTSGVWRPSAGSVYPSLQQLEDEDLISPEGEGRRRLYALTDEGRGYVQAHAEELRASWGAAAGRTDDAAMELGVLFRQVALAAMEVRRAGTPSQVAAAKRVLTEARRALYLILANDVTGEDGTPAGAGTPGADPEPTVVADYGLAGEQDAELADDLADEQDSE